MTIIITFRVTMVEQRVRLLSAYGHGENIKTQEEQYWAVVLDPGHVALDFGPTAPALQKGDQLMLVKP